uniref:Uncharacterized protein n=1 Tax=Eptatretus burgeri TaxID=7764 RepID=A0A8C4N4I5_EPTBU
MSLIHISHGFEIICARSTKAKFHSPRGIGISPKEHTFLESLKSHGYFQGELEGSQKYQDHLKAAQAYFNESIIEPRGELNPGEDVLLLLKDTPVDLKDLTRKEKALPPEDGKVRHLCVPIPQMDVKLGVLSAGISWCTLKISPVSFVKSMQAITGTLDKLLP